MLGPRDYDFQSSSPELPGVLAMSAARLGRNIFIVSAKRTPFGTFGGKLKNVSATDLASLASKAALKACNIAVDEIDSVIMGNVNQVSNNDDICIYNYIIYIYISGESRNSGWGGGKLIKRAHLKFFICKALLYSACMQVV